MFPASPILDGSGAASLSRTGRTATHSYSPDEFLAVDEPLGS